MAKVRHVGPTAHVCLNALDIDNPNRSGKILWQTSAPHLESTHQITQYDILVAFNDCALLKLSNCYTFSTAGSSNGRSWTVTGMWALIFSFTASSRVWSWPGLKDGVSSSMLLLWRPCSLEVKPQDYFFASGKHVYKCIYNMCINKRQYHDVVLYPNNESAKAVIKCWPERKGKML